MLDFGWGSLPLITGGQSRAITAENPRGERGRGGMAASELGPSRKGAPCLRDVPPGETLLGEIEGPGVIRHIWITVTEQTSPAQCYVLRDLVLRFYWDGEERPSVEVPLGDFFCCGFGRSCLVNSLAVAVNPTGGLNCYFPMPFRKGAKVTVLSQHENPVPCFFYQIDYTLGPVPEGAGYFHAQWRHQRLTEKAQDYAVLDQVQGAGKYVGTYLALTTLERYWWGEGEMKFYLDGDTDYPTICGTGTEDYFGGAWCFTQPQGGRPVEQTYCTPFLGYPFYSRHDTVPHPLHNDDCPPMRGFYRWHIPDPILFSRDIRVTLQQIGINHRGMFERQDDVATVAYWYQDKPFTQFPPLPPKEERWPR